MALLDIFKKKHEKKTFRAEPKKKVVKKEVVKKEAAKKEVKKEARVAPAVPMRPKKASASAYRTLKYPLITEKATDLTKFNQYVFHVYKGVSKTEVGKAVQDIYGVKVVGVKVINIHPKQRRLGRIEGWRKGYKKVIVRLAEGQKIEILPR